jgi:starch synthase (maltosyl-transferring)
LLNDERHLWRGTRNWVRLEPHTKPAHIFRIRRWQGKDQEFDHFR